MYDPEKCCVRARTRLPILSHDDAVFTLAGANFVAAGFRSCRLVVKPGKIGILPPHDFLSQAAEYFLTLHSGDYTDDYSIEWDPTLQLLSTILSAKAAAEY